MNSGIAAGGVDSQSRPIDQDPDLIRRLWYADPTGETAVRQVLAVTSDDLTVVDARGNPVFLIRRNVLIEEVVPHLSFTPTRRGDNIRAHKKNALTAGGNQREGENQNPTVKKEN